MIKDWIVTIGIDKFYLTNEEVKFYLHAINDGIKYVEINKNLILSSNCQSLVRFKNE